MAACPYAPAIGWKSNSRHRGGCALQGLFAIVPATALGLNFCEQWSVRSTPKACWRWKRIQNGPASTSANWVGCSVRSRQKSRPQTRRWPHSLSSGISPTCARSKRKSNTYGEVLCRSAICARPWSGCWKSALPNYNSLLRGFWQAQGRLSEDVDPSLGRAHVRIAEPHRVVERLAVVGTLLP